MFSQDLVLATLGVYSLISASPFACRRLPAGRIQDPSPTRTQDTKQIRREHIDFLLDICSVLKTVLNLLHYLAHIDVKRAADAVERFKRRLPLATLYCAEVGPSNR